MLGWIVYKIIITYPRPRPMLARVPGVQRVHLRAPMSQPCVQLPTFFYRYGSLFELYPKKNPNLRSAFELPLSRSTAPPTAPA